MLSLARRAQCALCLGCWNKLGHHTQHTAHGQINRPADAASKTRRLGCSCDHTKEGLGAQKNSTVSYQFGHISKCFDIFILHRTDEKEVIAVKINKCRCFMLHRCAQVFSCIRLESQLLRCENLHYWSNDTTYLCLDHNYPIKEWVGGNIVIIYLAYLSFTAVPLGIDSYLGLISLITHSWRRFLLCEQQEIKV